MGICQAFEFKQAAVSIPKFGGKCNFRFKDNVARKYGEVKLDVYPLTEEEYMEMLRIDKVVTIFEKIATNVDSDNICIQRDDESELFDWLEFKCLIGIPCEGSVTKPTLRSMRYLTQRIAGVLQSENEEFANSATISQDWCLDKVGGNARYMEFYRIFIRSTLKKEAV